MGLNAIFHEANTLVLCLSSEDYNLLPLLEDGKKYMVTAYTDFFFMGKPGKSDKVRLKEFGNTMFPAAFFDFVEE